MENGETGTTNVFRSVAASENAPPPSGMRSPSETTGAIPATTPGHGSSNGRSSRRQRSTIESTDTTKPHQAPLVPFPENTSHVKRWIFRTQKELDRIREHNLPNSINLHVAETLEQSGIKNLSVPQCPLTPEIQKLWCQSMARTGKNICSDKGLNHRVADTTLTFFNRFYTKESMARYPPAKTLLACLIVAIKAENLGERIKVSFLFHDLPKYTPEDIFQLEPVVMSVLDFELLVLHAQTPLFSLLSDFYRAMQRSNSPIPLEASKILEASHHKITDQVWEFCQLLQNEGEDLCISLHASDLPFICTPSEIAIGVFLYLVDTKFRVEPHGCGLKFVVDEFFPRQLRSRENANDPELRRRFRERAAEMLLHIVTFLEEYATLDARMAHSGFGSITSELLKWNSRLKKGTFGRRKKGDGATPSVASTPSRTEAITVAAEPEAPSAVRPSAAAEPRAPATQQPPSPAVVRSPPRKIPKMQDTPMQDG